MIDQRTDELLRTLDVAASPDPAFVASTATILRPRVRAARAADRRPLARLRADLRLAAHLIVSGTRAPRGILVAALGLLLLALLAGLIVMAAAINHRPIANGSLILALHGQLRVIDPENGLARVIGPPGEQATQVSRSPDGKLVAYWLPDPSGDQLMLMGIDGRDRHRVAANVAVTAGPGPGQWSPDSRFIAIEAKGEGASRILRVDVETGAGRFVTPVSSSAHWPLWSPDGQWIAFRRDIDPFTRVLSIMRADGSETRDVSGQLPGGVQVDGANSWSPDGRWIYFPADPWVFRTDVATATSTRLTREHYQSAAPALSPDGTLLAYIVSTPSNWDLYVANSDGTGAHLVLNDATDNGWSTDGRFVLSRWTPSDQPGGLTLVSPDGSGYRVVVPADQACPDRTVGCDVDWGQPRP
jgi:Tol biopolymer transport system component